MNSCPTPTWSRLAHWGVVVTFLIALVTLAAACGGDDDDAGPAPGNGNDDGNGSQTNGNGDGGGNGNGDSDPADDPNNPWVLGYRFTGDEGTEFTIDQTLVTSSGDQTQTQDHTVTAEIAEDEFWTLYTGFIEDAEIDVEVTSGGSLTFELLVGRGATGGSEIEVREVLETVTLSAGETATVAGSIE